MRLLKKKSKGKVYIAGPMRGIEYYNFPAFDDAAFRFREGGWDVINPAELDRVNGAHEFSDNQGTDFLREAMRRDTNAICDCTAIALLPGYEKSKGTEVELVLAKLLGLEVLDAKTMLPLKKEKF